MCLFCKKKKKHTALKVVAIVFTSLAALAALYVLFDRVIRKKLLKKKDQGCAEDECAEIAVEVEPACDACDACDACAE